MNLDDRPPHGGYPEPEPPTYEIPRRESTRPCPTGQVGITDRWVAYAQHRDLEGPFELCPACLNWHTPNDTTPTTSTFLQAQADRIIAILGPPPPERWPDDPDALLWWDRAFDLLGQLTDDQVIAAAVAEPHLLADRNVIEALRDRLMGLFEPLADTP